MTFFNKRQINFVAFEKQHLYLIVEDSDWEVPLQRNSLEVEPHLRVLAIRVNELAEMLLHLRNKKSLIY